MDKASENEVSPISKWNRIKNLYITKMGFSSRLLSQTLLKLGNESIARWLIFARQSVITKFLYFMFINIFYSSKNICNILSLTKLHEFVFN